MKKITWVVCLMDNGQIASMETATNIPQDAIESHLLIIGILENLKQKHQEKLKTLFSKTVKKKNGVFIKEGEDIKGDDDDEGDEDEDDDVTIGDEGI